MSCPAGCTELANGGCSCPANTNPFGIQAFDPSQYGLGVPGYNPNGLTNSETLAGAGGQTTSPLSNVLSSIGQTATTEIGAAGAALGVNPSVPGSLLSDTGAIAEIGNFFSIITDIPRMSTIVIGLILLTAGLFMLGAKPAVNIVNKAASMGLIPE